MSKELSSIIKCPLDNKRYRNSKCECCDKRVSCLINPSNQDSEKYELGGEKWPERDVERLRKDYEYMDDIDSIADWIWEFIRRSKDYKSIIDDLQELKKDVPKMYVNYREDLFGTGITWISIQCRSHNEDQCRKKINKSCPDEITGKLNSMGIAFSKFGYETESSVEGWVTFNDDEHKITVGIPHHKNRSNQFVESNRPIIKGIKVVKCFTAEEFMGRLYKGAKDGKIDFKTPPIILSPDILPMECLYMGISRNAEPKQIMKELKAIVTKYITDRENRPNKGGVWKYYLIAYDLKYKYGCSHYSEIRRRLIDAYPNSVPDDFKTGKNYYKAAEDLINGGYKKYLIETLP